MGSVRQHLSVEEVAERLAVSVSTVRREVRRGKLRPRRVGRQLRFDEMHLLIYLAERTGAGRQIRERDSERSLREVGRENVASAVEAPSRSNDTPVPVGSLEAQP